MLTTPARAAAMAVLGRTPLQRLAGAGRRGAGVPWDGAGAAAAAALRDLA